MILYFIQNNENKANFQIVAMCLKQCDLITVKNIHFRRKYLITKKIIFQKNGYEVLNYDLILIENRYELLMHTQSQTLFIDIETLICKRA